MATNSKQPDIDALRAQLPEFERRMVPGAIELRKGDGPPKIGMTIPFGKESADLGFTEIIDRGAFTKTLQERGGDVVALWGHDPLFPLARQSNGTFEVRETDTALEGVATLDPKNLWHTGFYAPAVERGDVKGSSFGFKTVRDDWEYTTDDAGNTTAVRTLLEVKLLEMSPVVFPAYPDSSAESRAIRALGLAAVRGIDPVELAAALNGVEDGKVAAKHVESVRRWIATLTSVLPVSASPQTATGYVPAIVRQRALAVLMRQHSLRRSVGNGDCIQCQGTGATATDAPCPACRCVNCGAHTAAGEACSASCPSPATVAEEMQAMKAA